jgi:nucleoside 2-deoxyribosyltransferase
MRHLKSLVLTPLDAAGQRVHDTVSRALSELGVIVLRLDTVEAGAMLANAITDAIRSADFLVADLSRQNPNAIYEIGFAHALRKPTFILMSSDSKASLPSDLLGHQYIVYDTDNMRGLSEGLRRATKGLLARGAEEA